MMAARLLCGIVAAGVTPSIYALAGNAAPPGRRGTWIAIVLTGLLFSLPLGALLGGRAADRLGSEAAIRISLTGLFACFTILHFALVHGVFVVAAGGFASIMPVSALLAIASLACLPRAAQTRTLSRTA
jgi:predicted MFS family arabinose efflux permease